MTMDGVKARLFYPNKVFSTAQLEGTIGKVSLVLVVGCLGRHLPAQEFTVCWRSTKKGVYLQSSITLDGNGPFDGPVTGGCGVVQKAGVAASRDLFWPFKFTGIRASVDDDGA